MAYSRIERRVDWKFDGFQGHSCHRGIGASGWREFCIEQLAKHAL